MPTKLDLAYVAGIVDGEGCITAFARTDSRSTRLSLSIAMCAREIIKWITMIFPQGRMYEKNAATNARHDWRRSWVFIASDKKAAEILEMLLPYLKLKKKTS